MIDYNLQELCAFHEKWKFPETACHFITVTLNPKFHKYQSITQYEMTVNELTNIMDKYLKHYAMTVELTKAGNIHYHMVAFAKSYVELYNMINKIKRNHRLGFCYTTPEPIDKPDQVERAFKYLIKDIDVTAQIINTPNYKPRILYIH